MSDEFALETALDFIPTTPEAVLAEEERQRQEGRLELPESLRDADKVLERIKAMEPDDPYARCESFDDCCKVFFNINPAMRQFFGTSNQHDASSIPSRCHTLLPVGTRIRFIKSLYGEATGDSPACVYAKKGDGGVVTGHGTPEGHWVKWDHWPAAFGAEYGTEFVEADA